MSWAYSARAYPQPAASNARPRCPRRHSLVFLTNNFTAAALTIAQLYHCRWQIELFFKWIKQHLRIKAFFGRSENAVQTQIWIAVAVYVLVAIVKKRLNASASLYTILQILSLTLFDKQPLDQLLAEIESQARDRRNAQPVESVLGYLRTVVLRGGI